MIDLDRGGLGYDAIESVDYKADPMMPNPFGINPNRLSLRFASGLTNNAERIELFTTSREVEHAENVELWSPLAQRRERCFCILCFVYFEWSSGFRSPSRS